MMPRARTPHETPELSHLLTIGKPDSMQLLGWTRTAPDFGTEHLIPRSGPDPEGPMWPAPATHGSLSLRVTGARWHSV